MSQKSENENPFDPTGMFKGMRDVWMDSWSKSMIQMVNSQEYAQASARMMDAWLAGSAPFRKAVESTMTQVLTQLNMPTRTNVTSLAERLTHIEMRLDDLEAKLDDRSQPGKAAPGKSKETST